MASPTTCTQQSSLLNFSGIWCPNTSTQININIPDNIIEIVSNNVDNVYDSWRNRGFSPMLFMEMNTNSLCINAKLSIDIDTSSFTKCIGGIMLLDTEYKPLLECGIGSWVDVPSSDEELYIENNNSPIFSSPISPILKCGSSPIGSPSISICGKNDFLNPSVIYTFFRPHYEETEFSYSKTSRRYDDEILIQLNYDKITKRLTFYDGEKTNSITFLPSVKYISFFMRGYGKNKLTIKNLSYQGLIDHNISLSTNDINNYNILKNAKTFGNDITKGTNVTLDSCMTLCKISKECKYFEYDSPKSLCNLKNSFENEYIYSREFPVLNSSPISPAALTNSYIYIEKIKVPLVSGFFTFINPSTNSDTTLNIGNGINITTLCIDNSYSRSDFIARDSNGNLYISEFGYNIITHPDTNTGTICLEFSIRQTKFYIISEKNKNFRSLIILDSNKNKFVNIKIVNLNYGIMNTLSSGIFELGYIDSSRTSMVKQQSNSFVMRNRQLYSSTVNDNTTINNTIIQHISPCKIIISNDPLTIFMPISMYDLCLITPTSLWPFSQIGDIFSSNQKTSTLPTTPPQITSFSLPDVFLNDQNWGYKYTNNNKTIYLSKAGGNFYYVYEYKRSTINSLLYFTFNVYVGIITDKGLEYTDDNNISYILYASILEELDDTKIYTEDDVDLNYINSKISFYELDTNRGLFPIKLIYNFEYNISGNWRAIGITNYYKINSKYGKSYVGFFDIYDSNDNKINSVFFNRITNNNIWLSEPINDFIFLNQINMNNRFILGSIGYFLDTSPEWLSIVSSIPIPPTDQNTDDDIDILNNIVDKQITTIDSGVLITIRFNNDYTFSYYSAGGFIGSGASYDGFFVIKNNIIEAFITNVIFTTGSTKLSLKFDNVTTTSIRLFETVFYSIYTSGIETSNYQITFPIR